MEALLILHEVMFPKKADISKNEQIKNTLIYSHVQLLRTNPGVTSCWTNEPWEAKVRGKINQGKEAV